MELLPLASCVQSQQYRDKQQKPVTMNDSVMLSTFRVVKHLLTTIYHVTIGMPISNAIINLELGVYTQGTYMYMYISWRPITQLLLKVTFVAE